MHRSGTSLVSHWLISCGLNLGDMLMGASIGNVEGHFEDMDFYRFHEDTLSANQLSKCGWTTKPINTLSVYQKERLKSIIGFKNKISGQWGWKDPRTCLFLSHYRDLIPDAYYLNIARDYQSTVSSMIIRDFKHYETKYDKRSRVKKYIWKNFRREKHLKKFYADLAEFYLKVWLAYNEEILENTEHLFHDQYMFVDYLNLYKNDREVFNVLKNGWHFDLKYNDFKKIFKENLLNKPVNIDPLIGDQSLLDRARAIEKRLKGLCVQQKELPKVLKSS
jgi:hypothetical protein